MMGQRNGDQASLSYEFRLEEHRRITCSGGSTSSRPRRLPKLSKLEPSYSDIGRPSLIRTDNSYTHHRALLRTVFGTQADPGSRTALADRWFCRLDLDDKVPRHATF